MTNNSKKTSDIENIFSSDSIDDLKTNSRTTVRYVREDIKASLSSNIITCLFCSPLRIQLLDISSKGALISSDRKFRKNKKITIIFEFKDGQIFKIKARIVRLDTFNSNIYGVKFDKYNDALGDYIFKTQTELIFK